MTTIVFIPNLKKISECMNKQIFFFVNVQWMLKNLQIIPMHRQHNQMCFN